MNSPSPYSVDGVIWSESGERLSPGTQCRRSSLRRLNHRRLNHRRLILRLENQPSDLSEHQPPKSTNRTPTHFTQGAGKKVCIYYTEEAQKNKDSFLWICGMFLVMIFFYYVLRTGKIGSGGFLDYFFVEKKIKILKNIYINTFTLYVNADIFSNISCGIIKIVFKRFPFICIFSMYTVYCILYNVYCILYTYLRSQKMMNEFLKPSVYRFYYPYYPC